MISMTIVSIPKINDFHIDHRDDRLYELYQSSRRVSDLSSLFSPQHVNFIRTNPPLIVNYKLQIL